MKSAFERFLLANDRKDSIHHVYDCLRNGPGGNMAWELMEKYNGNWKCKPEEMLNLIAETLEKLEEDSLNCTCGDEMPVCECCFKKEALEAGIPLSVIEGKSRLTDHFSKDYINFKANKKDDSDDTAKN